MLFRDGRGHVTRQADIERCWGWPASYLRERAVDFPAPAGDRAIVRLVVNGYTRDAEQEIRLRIARHVEGAIAGKVAGDADNPEAILESFGAYVHLIGAIVDPN